ncbi:hypothetical protein [Streptomyces sp. NPDC057325]|uniref:hypothetical protein n=1 Tax=unclassified Streptomyces TaxID=2593676 RepID=UPI00363A382B
MSLPHRAPGGGRPSPRAVDALVAGAVLLVVVVWVLVAGRRADEPALRAVLGRALVAAGCGALCFRRRLPVAVAAVTLLACAVYYPLSAQDGPLMITFAPRSPRPPPRGASPPPSRSPPSPCSRSAPARSGSSPGTGRSTTPRSPCWPAG